MTSEADFLNALHQSPDDDDLRLVFADWLEEHDDPHAELFRLSANLATMTEDDLQTEVLTQRAVELRHRDMAAWLGPLAGRVISWEVRRGLLQIRARAETLATFLDDPEVDRVLRWVRLLDLVGEVNAIRDVLACPHLLVLDTLDLGCNRLSDGDVEELADFPHMARLSSLLLYNNAVGVGGMEALCRSPHLRGLRELSLAGNRVTDRGHWLLGRPFPQLQSLDLSRNPLENSGIVWLSRARREKGLTCLGLFQTGCSAAGARALASCPVLEGVERLSLGHNALQDAGVAALADSPYLQRLRSLDLSGSQVSGAGVVALLNAPGLARLEALYLGNNGLRVEGVRRMATRPGLSRLRKLELRNNGLGDEGAKLILASPFLHPQTSIDLQGNYLSDSVKKELSRRRPRTRV
jgi:uncharacterized protein (TIGR02996 family)